MKTITLILMGAIVGSIPSALCGQAVVIGGRVKKEAPPRTPETYQERNEQSPLNKTFDETTLALPLITALKITGPKKVESGKFALPEYGKSHLQHEILWRIIPWQEKHAEFIEKYAKIRDLEKEKLEQAREQIKLFLWCEKNQLPFCAEFTMRNWVFGRGRVKSSLYVKNLQRLRKYAQQNPPAYTFDLPLKDQWHALVDETRHHQKKHWAIFAHDLVIQTNGRLHIGLNVKENHFAWQQPVYAVSDGVVVRAEDKHKDHPIGRPGPLTFANTVRIDCGGGIYADYAHLREDSVLVKKGDKIERGQMLARVGNSGASGVPHLHFSMMDRDGFSIPGRYNFEVLTTSGWEDLSGSAIEEGWNFRPLEK